MSEGGRHLKLCGFMCARIDCHPAGVKEAAEMQQGGPMPRASGESRSRFFTITLLIETPTLSTYFDSLSDAGSCTQPDHAIAGYTALCRTPEQMRSN